MDRFWDFSATPRRLFASVQVGKALSEARPEPRRKIVDLRTPPRDPAHLPPGLVTVGEFPE